MVLLPFTVMVPVAVQPSVLPTVKLKIPFTVGVPEILLEVEETPAGNPVTLIPVRELVLKLIVDIGFPKQMLAGLFTPVMELDGSIVIVPEALIFPQPPDKGILYENGLPTAVVGVPVKVIVFAAQDAVIPGGNPVAAPIPVAPVVVMVLLVPKVAPAQKVGEIVVVVLVGFTMIVPVALTVPQPPVIGME
jgi:hypothetical protein